MNRYTEMKERHSVEVNAFPMFFAFNNQSFYEGMQKLGLYAAEQVCSIGYGGYIRKTDKDKYIELLRNHRKELETAISEDKTGNSFIYEMFLYELSNHEYSFTLDYEDTLNALGFTYDDLEKHPNLKHGITKAAKKLGSDGGF